MEIYEKHKLEIILDDLIIFISFKKDKESNLAMDILKNSERLI